MKIENISVQGGGGGGGVAAPRILQVAFLGQKKQQQVIFQPNHLIFGQALEKLFGQETSAPRTKLAPSRYAYG